MGQEASVPADPDLEEQARAPPSVAHPPPPSLRTVGRPGSKLGQMFRTPNDFEGKEAARAAATGGNFYPEEQLQEAYSNGSGANQYQNEFYPNQPPPPPADFDDGQQPVSVGVMYDGKGSKRGFGRAQVRGAALINSMRNLSLKVGSARKQEANEWAKQWDEDEDDDDDEEEQDFAITTERPGMDMGHGQTMASVVAPPPGHAIVTAKPLPLTEPPEDLLSKPLPHQQQIQDDTVEWDSAVSPDDSGKPNVQMFMPMLRVLGKGSFGKVVLVQKQTGKERGQLFAMKILRKTHLVKRRQIERTRTERKVLSVVNHPFIMKLHYAFQSDDKLYLVLDYCPGGELFFHLSRFRRFPERVARFYAAELLLAIGHLHKRGIIYRDLKPENVLLDADGHVKLGDFGLAKAGVKHPYEGAMSMCGTPEYMAPEVLAQAGHGFCVDYWGLGMLTYEMMTGLPPWYTTDRSKLFRRLKSAPLEVPSYFSAAAGDCVSALLERNPRRRLGVQGIRTAMEHEFFRNISWRSLYARRVEAPIRPCEGWKPPFANGEEDPLSQNGHGHGPDRSNMDNYELEAATANFDNTFTRMPVESEDGAHDVEDEGAEEELHADTFLGFSFDIREPRQRTHAAAGQLE